jgi:hypothetical protein
MTRNRPLATAFWTKSDLDEPVSFLCLWSLKVFRFLRELTYSVRKRWQTNLFEYFRELNYEIDPNHLSPMNSSKCLMSKIIHTPLHDPSARQGSAPRADVTAAVCLGFSFLMNHRSPFFTLVHSLVRSICAERELNLFHGSWWTNDVGYRHEQIWTYIIW